MIFLGIALVFVLAGSTALYVFNYPPTLENKAEQKPFYVGVTYCGNVSTSERNAVAEAKLLIDRVKNYTNLFVLQSGSLQWNREAREICDYAVDSGLNVIVYLSVFNSGNIVAEQRSFIATAKERLGNRFLGIYYGDEPGGRMFDDKSMQLYCGSLGENVTRELPIVDELPANLRVTKSDGTNMYYYHALSSNNSQVTLGYPNGTSICYMKGDLSYPNGTSIALFQNAIAHLHMQNGTFFGGSNDTHYPNGTVIATNYYYYVNGTVARDREVLYFIEDANQHGEYPSSNLTDFEFIDKNDAPPIGTYEEAFALLPFKTSDEVASRFVDHCQSTISWVHDPSINFFTSDYALHWFDYLGGYDVVLAQFGWNNTLAQEIALVRGAATIQNKSWGAMLTWKYDEDPYLADGDEIFNQMRTAYECGAEYVIIFNYPTIEGNSYGILQDEHFEALERFWNDVVQNSSIINGAVKTEAVLVLPKNYGWGMRHQNDTIWGLWQPDDKSGQIWTRLQDTLAEYDIKLDIVYDDSMYPVADKYAHVYYWNQID